MTVEQIKSEFEKLSQMLASWQQGEEIATIERDLALDKLKKIYDALRFEPKLESTTIPIPAIDLSAVDQKAEPNDEQQNEEEEEENPEYFRFHYCSNCGEYALTEEDTEYLTPYCPECSAKMDNAYEENEELKAGHIALIGLAKSILETSIHLLGFSAPEKM